MRALIISVALALCTTAIAQPLPERPDTAAPAASAPVEQRQAWCQQYVAWFVAHTTDPMPAPDQRATHRFEVEFDSCSLDPQGYERQTIAEIARTTEAA